MRSDFGPLLPQLVPHLLDVAARKDAASFDFAEDDDDEGGGFNAAFGEAARRPVADTSVLVIWDDATPSTPSTPPRASARRRRDSEESDDDSLAGQAVVTVRTAMMNVKRAVVALGNLAEYTEGCLPHLKSALECLVLVDYFHHGCDAGDRPAAARPWCVFGPWGPPRDPAYAAPPNDEKEPKA